MLPDPVGSRPKGAAVARKVGSRTSVTGAEGFGTETGMLRKRGEHHAIPRRTWNVGRCSIMGPHLLVSILVHIERLLRVQIIFLYYRLMAAAVEVEHQEDHVLVCPVVTAWS